MNQQEAMRRLKARFGTPQRMMQVLGLDADPNSTPTTPLDFLRSRMDPEDLDKYLNMLLIEAQQRGREAADRRTARDTERTGNLEIGELREGLTESAQAQDAAIHSAIPTAAEIFGTTHEPGIA